MKIKVEYSESIQVAEGLWRKCGVELEMDTETDSFHPSGLLSKPEEASQLLHNQAKGYVQRWHKEAQPQFDGSKTRSSQLDEAGQWATPPPVINRESERFEILIDNSKTIEELAVHKAKMPRELLPIYMNKLRELTKKI